jgi:hypothetical protein
MGRGDEFGTLEQDKLADVLVVDGDVLADIRLLEDRTQFPAVMQGGVINAGKLAGRHCASDYDPNPLLSQAGPSGNSTHQTSFPFRWPARRPDLGSGSASSVLTSKPGERPGNGPSPPCSS